MNEVPLGAKTSSSNSLVDTVEREWHMTLPVPGVLSNSVPFVQLSNVTVGYNHDSSSKTSVLRDLNFEVEGSSRLAVIGSNGCGKSTLLKAIESLNGPDCSAMVLSGDAKKLPNVRVAYYQQHLQDSLPYDISPLEYLSLYCEQQLEAEIKLAGASAVDGHSYFRHTDLTLRSHLGSFGISGDLALRKIGLLSGGQKARVVLAQLTLSHPHLLLLDEPTNNLDMDGIRALSDALHEFQGAYIVTSHDMDFVNRNCDTVFVIEKGILRRLEGGAEEYKSAVKEAVLKKYMHLTK